MNIQELARGWIEAYEDFRADMEDMGLTFDQLPNWSAGVPVRVIALPMGVMLLSKASRRELLHYQKMLDSGRDTWIAAALMRDVESMHIAKVTAVDPVKIWSWRVKNGYEPTN